MTEFILKIIPYFDEILPYLVTLVTTFMSYLIYKVAAKSQKEEIKSLKSQLEQAKSKETYIKCPHCNSKLPLSELSFYLPGDVKDNNLNGIPDDQENID